MQVTLLQDAVDRLAPQLISLGAVDGIIIRGFFPKLQFLFAQLDVCPRECFPHMLLPSLEMFWMRSATDISTRDLMNFPTLKSVRLQTLDPDYEENWITFHVKTEWPPLLKSGFLGEAVSLSLEALTPTQIGIWETVELSRDEEVPH